jgi:hypothetical protein
MSETLFEILNRDCRCISMDPSALSREALRLLGEAGASLPPWADSSVFATVPVFVSPEHIQAMRDTVSAVTALTLAPSYCRMALERAPAIARHHVAQKSVFFGYDFHLGKAGPALIEINTNAGGAFLNLLLARAQKACCEEVDRLVASGDRIEKLDEEFVQMFRDEWALARGEQTLSYDSHRR